MEAEIEDMYTSQACLKPPKAGNGKVGLFSRVFLWRESGPADTLILNFWTLELRKNKFL